MFLLLALLSFVVYASTEDCHRCSPGNYTGTLLGAGYEIKVPANFNGILVLYARGYADVVPGAEAFFGGDDYEAPLLNAGYALAGSNYGAAGWAVKEGILTTTALRLVFMKVARGCLPKKVLLYGSGMGSVVALSMAENAPKCLPLSGVVAGCALGAGTTRTWDVATRYNLAFMAINDKSYPWGTPNDITEGLNFTISVFPRISQNVAQPSWRLRLEYQRVINHLPRTGYFSGSSSPTIYQNFFYATQAMAELEQRAGGAVSQNVGETYSISAADRTYLNSLGMTNSAIDIYLLFMINNDFAANATARAYLAKYADFDGDLQVPVITLHNMEDGVVPVSSESAYAQTVSAAGKSSLLYQAYTTSTGHCNFTPEQLYTTIAAAAAWVTAGTVPSASSFPASAGFNTSFVPPAWPY